MHCDLALRNIMVNKFPWEVKVAEFSLARDMTRMTSHRGSRWRSHRVRKRSYILPSSLPHIWKHGGESQAGRRNSANRDVV